MKINLLQSILSLLVIAILITACGQKGPLYLPEVEQPDKRSNEQSS
ncbi:MAG: lipoprotein [Candidatus Thiodiazotropha sp. (ex. Lucinoma kazani)]